MNKEHLLTVLQQEISRSPHDLKAEAILALAMEQGLGQDDFVMVSESAGKRPFSRDVLNPVIEEDRSKNPYIQLSLSRDGWYDQLPEGLFHQPLKSAVSDLSVGKMAAEYVKNKQIEVQSRRFFKPFEQAFYDLKLELELEEFTLLKGLHTGKLNEFLVDFWGIKADLPSKFIPPFVEMLPKIHKINGNPDQIAACLESIIQETVEVKVEIGFCEVREDLGLNTLANSRLGLDMIMGNKFLEESLQYAFLIGPLKHSCVSDYLEGGSHQALLKIFYDYFLPVEADGIMHLKLSEEAMINTLDQHTPPILGHSFLLVA